MWGETTRVENRGETTRGNDQGKTSWGQNVLLPFERSGTMIIGFPNIDNLYTGIRQQRSGAMVTYLQIQKVEQVQRTAARQTCRRWGNTRGFGDMLDEIQIEWPSLEAHREQSSLTLFYKSHPSTASFEKDKYLTPAPNLRRPIKGISHRPAKPPEITGFFITSPALWLWCPFYRRNQMFAGIFIFRIVYVNLISIYLRVELSL